MALTSLITWAIKTCLPSILSVCTARQHIWRVRRDDDQSHVSDAFSIVVPRYSHYAPRTVLPGTSRIPP